MKIEYLKVIFFFTLICFQLQVAVAKEYYFSSLNGDDSNSGESPGHALRSISKMQEIIDNAQAGDLILLERGSVWEDAMVKITHKTNFAFTAYGEGSKPVISGYKELNNPFYMGNNLYVYDTQELKDDYRKSFNFQVGGSYGWYACNLNFLLIDGKPYDLGRHPNGKNYFDMEGVNSDKKSSFTEIDKLWNDGYWDGAQVKLFPAHWIPEDVRVSKFADNTFELNTGDWNSQYNLSKQDIWYGTGIKYYIFNHRNTLDKDGEWCFDRDNKTITVYSSVPLDDKKVMQSFNDTVISINGCTDLIVRDIEFRGGKKYTLNLINSTNVSVDSCIFRYTPIYAAFVDNNTNISFKYSSFIDVSNMGIFFHANNGETAEYCYARNIGVSEGIGGDRDNNCFRFLNSHHRNGGVVYEHNTIDSFGYAGITIFLPDPESTDPVSVKYNHIKNGPMLLTDAAAFYVSADRTTIKKEIKHNVVENIYSNIGNSWNSGALSMGLYLDVDAQEFYLDSNTIVNSQYGIYLNGTNNNHIINNHIAMVTKTGMVGKDYGYGHDGKASVDCKYLNNVSVAANAQATGFEWYYGSFHGAGSVADSNHYYNPFKATDTSIGRYQNWSLYPSSLENWRSISDWEIHSSYNKNSYINNPAEIAPEKCVKVLWNLSNNARKVDLYDCLFVDLEGNEVSGSINIPPYYSEILFLISGDSIDYITNNSFVPEGVVSVVEKELYEPEINVYPVPAKDYVTIKNLPEKSVISVHDILGNKVFENTETTIKNKKLDLRSLTTGIYIIRISDLKNGRLRSFKIIKK